MTDTPQHEAATYLTARTVLCVSDVQQTAAYYNEVLGFEVRFLLPGQHAFVYRDGVEILFRESERLTIMLVEPASIGDILIAVDDIDLAHEALAARGAEVHPRASRPRFGYADLFVQDNNGYWLQFYKASSDRSLELVHRDLSKLPPLPALPAGYRLRTWQEGDQDKVPPVLGDAFFGNPEMGSFEHFHRFLAQRGAFIPENIFVIEAACGEAVGTTTARLESPQVGRLHRVGVRALHQGRGLGKILALRALHHLAERGVKKAYVQTEESRLAALSVYLQAGFLPLLDRAHFYEKWQRIPPYDLDEVWGEVYAKLAASTKADP